MFNGKRLKALRQSLGLSQYELGARIGRSPTYVQQLESGTKCESLNAAKLLCDTLGIRLDYLFDENDLPRNDDRAAPDSATIDAES